MAVKFTYTGDSDTAKVDTPLYATADEAVKDIHLDDGEAVVKINIKTDEESK